MYGNDDFDSFQIDFVGGRRAEVYIRTAQGTADIDLKIVDGQTGRTVVEDRRVGPWAGVFWTPPTTRRYTVEVRNYKKNINVAYRVITN